jgi:hypothetical protein
MRVCITLPILLLAAASPAAAQSPAPVYHGTGYDVVLPARYKPAETTSSADGDSRQQVSVFTNEQSVLFVGRFSSTELQDTALATRRALLQISRATLLHAGGKDVTLDGDLRDFERGDRIGLRVPVTMLDDAGRPMHGVTEMSVARGGPLELWMVMYLDSREGRGVSTGERVLDSFRITGAPPEEQAFQGRGFMELSDPKAKPRP